MAPAAQKDSKQQPETEYTSHSQQTETKYDIQFVTKKYNSR